ncbi:D-alanyl-D-alanine carboxypeptidase [Streptomyces sp. NPDC004376]
MEEASVAGESPDRSKQGNSVGSAEGVDSAESEERSAGAGAKGGANSVAGGVSTSASGGGAGADSGGVASGRFGSGKTSEGSASGKGAGRNDDASGTAAGPNSGASKDDSTETASEKSRSGSGGDNVSAGSAAAAKSGSASRAGDTSEPSASGAEDAPESGEASADAAERSGSPSGAADAPKSPAGGASRATKGGSASGADDSAEDGSGAAGAAQGSSRAAEGASASGADSAPKGGNGSAGAGEGSPRTGRGGSASGGNGSAGASKGSDGDFPSAGNGGSASGADAASEGGDKPAATETPDAKSGSAEGKSASASRSGSAEKPGAAGKAAAAFASDANTDPGQKPTSDGSPTPASKPQSAGAAAPASGADGTSAAGSRSRSAEKAKGNSAGTASPTSGAVSSPADKAQSTVSGAAGRNDAKSGSADKRPASGAASSPAVKSASRRKGEDESAPGTKLDDKFTPTEKTASGDKDTSASESGSADKASQDAPGGKTAPASQPEAATSAKPGSADGSDRKSSPADKPGGKLIPAPTSAPGDKATPTDQPTTTLRSPKQPQPPKDQPTTTLRAPKEVDQPTTMLKVGGKEKEAEKTSRFVALKGDIRTAPAEETRTVPQVGPERTTQQPLPPKPPLDLLAELTNTPPPPETPVRTLVRRVKIWTPLVLLLVVILGVVQALRPLPAPTLDLTAKDSYTFEGGKVQIPWPAEGQAALDVQGVGTFGSSGSDKPVPTASVAKVMTAYLILHDHPLKSGAAGPKIKIDKTAESQSKAGQESTVDVTAGDRITQREALQDILLASANNIARLLARWDAGSVDAFVAKMNTTAKRLGMSNTKYTDPSGLTDSTVSTARDQVKLAKAAMTYPAFREVAAMMSYTDYKGTYHSNWNQLVGHNNVVGIKTGTTTSALGNLVFAAKQDVDGETRMIIGAVMRQPAGGPENTILSAALDHSDKLIRAAQGALKSATVLKKGTVVGYVDDGLGGRTPVEVTEDVKATGWAGLKVKLSFTGGPVPHTAKAGTKVGSLTVGDGSTGAVQVPVALRDDLAEPGLGSKLTRLG